MNECALSERSSQQRTYAGYANPAPESPGSHVRSYFMTIPNRSFRAIVRNALGARDISARSVGPAKALNACDTN